MSRPDALSRALVDAAFELHGRRLWQSTESDALFLVRIPGEPHPPVATIIGHSGTDYGIVVATGAESWSHMLRFVTEPGHRLNESSESTILAITMDPLAKLPRPFRALLDHAGFSSRRDGLVPLAMAAGGGQSGRPPTRTQLRTLLHVIRAVLKAHDAGEFRPTPVDPKSRRVLELRVEGVSRDSTVKAASVPWPEVAPSFEPARPKWTAGARELPQIDERWSAGFVLQRGINRTIEGVTLLVVLRKPQGNVLGTTIHSAGEMDVACEVLAKILSGEARTDGVQGLPSEIVFGDEALAQECRAGLAELGVAVSVDRGDETLVTFEREMNADLDRDPASPDRAPAAPSPPRSLEEWKAADRALTAFLMESTQQSVERTKRAMTRYFGSRERASLVLDRLESYQPLAAFVEWFVADYRATKRSKTVLETMLATQILAPWQRHLIDARRHARLSVFRVDHTEPGSHLVLEDVLDGSHHTVHDRAFSGAVSEGLFIPLRLATVDRWTFLMLGGPPLPALVLDRALLDLEGLGVDLTPRGMRDSAELVGRLWPFMLELRDQRPRIGNTDGELLELQTATFKVGNIEELNRALAKRDDIEFDDDEGLWVWSRASDPKHGIGDVTLLGRLSLLDDQLVVEVNSAERLQRIRSWLDGVPGVRFQSSTARAWDRKDRPLDDKLKGKPESPPTPEIRKLVEEAILKSSLAWLDQQIPLLGGLTPRQACATEDGRRRGERMIRTMPAVMSSGGDFVPPRARLLRELGLAQ